MLEDCESCSYFSQHVHECRTLDTFYLCGSIVSLAGSLFVMTTYLWNPLLRKHPSVLLFSRSVCDFFFALHFFVLYMMENPRRDNPHYLACNKSTCLAMGSWLTLGWTASTGYFACSVHDLYTSMNNPFTKPATNIKMYHCCVLAYAGITTLILASSEELAWRSEAQLCWVKEQNRTGINWITFVLLEFPIGLVSVAALYVSVTARRRLRRGLADTFHIRMKALKDSSFYSAIFTIYFVVLGAWYFAIWVHMRAHAQNTQSFRIFSTLFAVTIGCIGVVDSLVWFTRKWYHELPPSQKCSPSFCSKSIFGLRIFNNSSQLQTHMTEMQNTTNQTRLLAASDDKTSWSRQPPKPGEIYKSASSATSKLANVSIKQVQDDGHTINKALRREVLAFTTDGIAQSVERASILSQKTGITPLTIPSQHLYPTSINDISLLTVSRFGLRIKYNTELLSDTPYHQEAPKINSPSPITPLDQNEAEQIAFNKSPKQTTNGKKVETGTITESLIPSTEEEKQAQVEKEFTDYAPLVFRFLRKRLLDLNDKEYVESIIPPTVIEQKDVLDAKFGEGRSGAFFYFTHDSRFLVKTITKRECQFFISILKQYVEYVHDNPDSALNLFLGLHSCRMYNLTLYYVVMENVFLANLKPHEVYDLKGSWVGRHTHAGINSGKIMKDMDLNRYVVLSTNVREKVLRQLESDSSFMRDLGVMDYSLLLGIYYMKITHNPPRDLKGFLPRMTSHSKVLQNPHTDTKEAENLLNDFHGGVRAQIIEGPGIYYIGMIDILQEWNWSKKMEYYFKTWILRHPAAGISCVEPNFYQKRFMAHMRRIIITDEEFLESNSIDTSMFHPQPVFQFPASEVMDDSFRSVRSSIITNQTSLNTVEVMTDGGNNIETPQLGDLSPLSPDNKPIANSVPNSLSNQPILIPKSAAYPPLRYQHLWTNLPQVPLRGTYRLHRGSTISNHDQSRLNFSPFVTSEVNKSPLSMSETPSQRQLISMKSKQENEVEEKQNPTTTLETKENKEEREEEEEEEKEQKQEKKRDNSNEKARDKEKLVDNTYMYGDNDDNYFLRKQHSDETEEEEDDQEDEEEEEEENENENEHIPIDTTSGNILDQQHLNKKKKKKKDDKKHQIIVQMKERVLVVEEKSKRNAIQEDKEYEPEEYDGHPRTVQPQIQVPKIALHPLHLENDPSNSNLSNNDNTPLSLTDQSFEMVALKPAAETHVQTDNPRNGGSGGIIGLASIPGDGLGATGNGAFVLSDSAFSLHEPIEPSATMTQSVFSYGAFMAANNPPAEKSEAQMGGGVTTEKNTTQHVGYQSGTFFTENISTRDLRGISMASDEGGNNTIVNINAQGVGAFQNFSANNPVENRTRELSDSMTENEVLSKHQFDRPRRSNTRTLLKSVGEASRTEQENDKDGSQEHDGRDSQPNNAENENTKKPLSEML